MAYNFPTATQDFGYGIGESEEERKRREEQERMQREQEAAMAAQQQAEAEAQRQREQQEAAQREAMAAQSQQSVAEIPSGMANPNPYGSAIAQGQTAEAPDPTQGGPVAPDQANIEQQRRLQQAQAAQAQQVAEMPQPVEQPQPQAVQQPVAPVAPEMPQLPQPGPGVQVAGPTQMPPQETGQGIRMPAPAAPQQAAPQMTMEERIAAAAQRAQERAGTAQPGQMPSASVGSLQQVAQQQVTPAFETRFTEASNDISKLDQLRKDETLTKEQRMLAGKQAQELLTRELGPVKAKEEVANMSEMEIARLLKSKSEEGSWGKLLLLGFVSPTLAAKEAAKLGLNDQWSTGRDEDGNPVLIKTRDGVPVEGISGATGKKLSAKELLSAAGSAPGKVKPDVSMQDVEKGGQAGRVVTTYDAQNRPRTMVESGGKMFPYDSTWKPRAISTAAAKVDYQLTSDLYKKHSGNVIDMLKDYETIRGPLTPEGRNEFFQKYGYGSTLPAAQQTPGAAPATTASGAVAQPITQPGAVAQPITQSAAPAAPVVPGAPAPAPAAVARPAAPVVPGAPAAPGGGVGVGAPIGSLQTQQALNKAAGEAEIQRKKEIAVAEQKPPAEAKGKVAAKDVNNQAFANETYGLIKPIAELVKKSTGSGIGAKVDSIASALGSSTEGAQAIAELEVLTAPILANVPRFEGAQSDYDVKTYQKFAGDFANAEKPIKTRLAALQGMITLLKKYDKAGQNDWSFAGQNPAAPTGQIRIISRERVQ